jgi:hypothetical protein
MAEPPAEPSTKIEAKAEVKKGNSVLPDTLFKILTRREVVESKLRVGESEFQHITRADLIIEVPPGVDTSGTLFDFCYPITVLEFKSENDEFNAREFVVNQVRTAILFLQAKSKEADYSHYLNTYVLARLPIDFLDKAAENGILFSIDQEKPWLRRAKVGFQNIAVIVCRDLPLERQFYRWLLFAPSDGKKWRAFIRRLKLEGEGELLDFAKKLRPREVAMVKVNAEELWELARQEGALTPEVEAQLARERAEAVEIILSDLANKDYFQMEAFFDDMSDGQLSRMVNALSTIRLVGLISYLKPAQIERLLPLIQSEKQRDLVQNLLAE